MTGPQTTLLAPIGDDDDDPYGETTRGWLRAAQDQHQAEAQDAIDSAVTGNAILPARSHARTRRSWLPPRFRRQAPGPVRTTLIADRPAPAAALPAPEPRDPDRTVGYVGPEHLQHGTQHDDSAPPDPRPYVPEPVASPAISALPWWTGDAPGWQAPEPMRHSPVLALAADLTELPGFRETLARSTRNRAAECLCGDEMTGDVWGERMMRQGIHMLSVWDLRVVRMLTEMAEAAPEAQRDGVAA